MYYYSEKTGAGNIGISCFSQEAADSNAKAMDCTDCAACKSCTDCTNCTIKMSTLNLGRFDLSTDHAASSYGIPVVVGGDGTAYGIGDILPLEFGHSNPATHVAAASMLRGKRQHPLVISFLNQVKCITTQKNERTENIENDE